MDDENLPEPDQNPAVGEGQAAPVSDDPQSTGIEPAPPIDQEQPETLGASSVPVDVTPKKLSEGSEPESVEIGVGSIADSDSMEDPYRFKVLKSQEQHGVESIDTEVPTTKADYLATMDVESVLETGEVLPTRGTTKEWMALSKQAKGEEDLPDKASLHSQSSMLSKLRKSTTTEKSSATDEDNTTSVSTTTAAGRAVAARPSRIKPFSTSMRNAMERKKKKQRDAKEARQKRAAEVEPTHNWLFDMVANHYGLKSDLVKEYVLDVPEQIGMVREFVKAGTLTRVLVWFYERLSPLALDASGRVTPKSAAGDPAPYRIVVTDTFGLGKFPVAWRNDVCYFINMDKENDLDSTKNIKALVFGVIPGIPDDSDDNNYGVLKIFIDFCRRRLLRQIALNEEWGEITPYNNWRFVDQFMDSFRLAMENLDVALESLNQMVFLNDVEDLNFRKSDGPTECKRLALQDDFLRMCENQAKHWINQVDTMIWKSKVFREDNDELGPRHEILYWRAQAGLFTFLFEQLHGHDVRMAKSVIIFGKSPLRKEWAQMESQLVTKLNEATDNVKFVKVICDACEPLYHPTLKFSEIGRRLRVIVKTIRHVHDVSIFYNTSELLSSIFIKVTNQLILLMRKRILHDDKGRPVGLFEQAEVDVHPKILECIRVYKDFLEASREMANKPPEHADEKPFKYSERYIFGKLIRFIKRLTELDWIFQQFHQFATLVQCNLLGAGNLMRRFLEIKNKYLTEVKKRDTLDFHDKEVHDDFAQFQQNLVKIELDIRAWVEDSLEGSSNSECYLGRLKEIEKTKMKFLDDEYWQCLYTSLLDRMDKEIDYVKEIYFTEGDDPPISHLMPPLSGRITWVRLLHSKLETPVNDVYENHPKIRAMPGFTKILRRYNWLGERLVSFEDQVIEIWESSYAPFINNSMELPVFARDTETRRLRVNMDTTVYQLMCYTKWIVGFGSEVARNLMKRNEKVIILKLEAEKLVLQYNDAMSRIPEILRPLMLGPINRINDDVRTCLIAVTWYSLLLFNYLKCLSRKLDQFELVVNQVTELLENRIRSICLDVRNICFIQFPVPGSVWTIDEFVSRQKDRCERMAMLIDEKSLQIENIVMELASILVEQSKEHVKPNELRKKAKGFLRTIDDRNLDPWALLAEYCSELFRHCFHLFTESFLAAAKTSLEAIRNIFQLSKVNVANEITADAIFSVLLVIKPPKVAMKPTLDGVQVKVNRIVRYVLEVSKGICLWGQHFEQPVVEDIFKVTPTESNSLQQYMFGRWMDYAFSLSSDNYASIFSEYEASSPLSIDPALELHLSYGTKNLHRYVTDAKDVIRVAILMNSCVSVLKSYFSSIVTGIESKIAYLWPKDPDRTELIAEFAEHRPAVTEYKAVLNELDLGFASTQTITDKTVGPIAIVTDTLKGGLEKEIHIWQDEYCKALRNQYVTQVESIIETIKVVTDQLNRPITDMESVRNIMDGLQTLRDEYNEIDIKIGPIEEAYVVLQEYKFELAKDEVEKVESLDYKFQKLHDFSKTISTQIHDKQSMLYEKLMKKREVVQAEITELIDEYETKGPHMEGIPIDEANDRLIFIKSKFEDIYVRYHSVQDGEKLFALDITDHPILEDMKKVVTNVEKLFKVYLDIRDSINTYNETPWSEVSTDAMENEIAEKRDKMRKLPKAAKEYKHFANLQAMVSRFLDSMPLLSLMAHPAMMDRHWKRLEEITEYKFDISAEEFKLKNVLAAPLIENSEDIEDVCIAAQKEKDIEFKLQQIVADCSVLEFSFAEFKNRGELLIKGTPTTDIISMLDDNLLILYTLLNNRYNAPFRNAIHQWITKLSTTVTCLSGWLQVQSLWLYLEAVFVGGDISKELPDEARRFGVIDRSWQKVMTKAHEETHMIPCCTGDEVIQNLLPHLQEQLEVCQRSLSGYLERKRLIFARFFFVSDNVLLEILGQGTYPRVVEQQLSNICEFTKMTFVGTSNTVLGVESQEQEGVLFSRKYNIDGPVEFWLQDIVDFASNAVGLLSHQAIGRIRDPSFDIMKFLHDSISQIALLVINLWWTTVAELALIAAKHDRSTMLAANALFLDVLNKLINVTVLDLGRWERRKYETLIIVHVHQRDIFDTLTKQRLKSVFDFAWLQNLRYYYDDEESRTRVSVTNVNFEYMNEFYGCKERLVITPLTDRCYITIAQALSMSLGANPGGPAGTGKTETTKDMAKALGKYCVVFNCSDQMDFRGLGRLFKGISISGSWGCFDEINRIDLPVLSVAAQQISSIFSAHKRGRSTFVFTDGDEIKCHRELGIIITMNPKYAGRHELPENLKIQFRPIAMVVPDSKAIIRVKLASIGFIQNEMLSEKFFGLYALCKGQLSKQIHYDFGLRNILACLRTMAGVKQSMPGALEAAIVLRVLKDMNLSKLVDEDSELFVSLMADLFPGIKLPKADYPDFSAILKRKTEEAGLVLNPLWKLKCVQLYETQNVRWGIMALGPSGSGKSTCIRATMQTLSELWEPHKEIRMNPKSFTNYQMFGVLDVSTNEWTDGIYSTLWRRVLKMKPNEHCWLVLDGPVDTLWIESLNSVLDDNKMLTLANGDRIPMSENCKLFFEINNLDNASPATVSRNGMVYMSSAVVDWRSVYEEWWRSRGGKEDTIDKALEGSFDMLYNYFFVELHSKMPVLEYNIIRQVITLMDGLLHHYAEMAGDASKSLQIKAPKGHLIRYIMFALMWSFGAFLDWEDRYKFEAFMKSETNLSLPPVKPGETIYEYRVGEDGEWKHWAEYVDEYVFPTDYVPDFASILVPNVDNVRTLFLIKCVQDLKKPVLLMGEQGSAKTSMMTKYMNTYDPDLMLYRTFNFSSATTPNLCQRTLESFVEKRMVNVVGPSGMRKMIVFIDDINLPVINDWGDQETNELVRQLIEMGGMYSIDKPGDFVTFQDLIFAAAMILPGGGHNDIPQRLKRHFAIFNCTMPSHQSMDQIFATIGLGYYCPERDFSDDIIQMINALVPATRHIWQNVKARLLPTPSKFHYIFNLRDLSRIWEGMLDIAPMHCKSVDTVIALWKHECQRVLTDKCINDDDKATFEKIVSNYVESKSNEIWGQYVVPTRPLFFHFMRDPDEFSLPDDADTDFKFFEYGTEEAIVGRIEKYQQEYNENVRGANMDLVLFTDCVLHLTRISRIIRRPSGHALLVGVGGSGKQSLTKMASFIHSYSPFQLALTRSYNVQNFIDDLKLVYSNAGKLGKGMSFLFSDNDIKDEGFLEYLNNLLSTGEMSNLFEKDEMDEILNELMPILKKEQPKTPLTMDNLYLFFTRRAKKNLHVVLCFSPMNQKFSSYALKFPALISCCTIDWFQRWPADALLKVSSHYLQEHEFVCEPVVKKNVIKVMADIHDHMNQWREEYFSRFRRSVFFTPKTYLSFLRAFLITYDSKLNDLNRQNQRVTSGKEKLTEAAEQVDRLKAELFETEKRLDVAAIEADKVLADVTEVQHSAEIAKAEVQKIKTEAEKMVKEIGKKKVEAQTKLADAEPALREAEEALKTITPGDIATVKKLLKPPHLIMRIMDCVLIYFNKKMDPVTADPEKPCNKPSWSESLKMMTDTSFLKKVKDYLVTENGKEPINDEMIDLLEPYMAMEDYNYESAKKVCGNVAGLLSWSVAMTQYYAVNKMVIPLKAALAQEENKYAVAMTRLKEEEVKLKKKDAELNDAKAKYDEAVRIKQAAMDEVSLCRDRLSNAVQLIDGLESERIRWTLLIKEFQTMINKLIGDILICSAFLSYAGPFNQEYRSLLHREWSQMVNRLGIPCSDNVNIIALMADPTTILEWGVQGLPSDNLSIENAIVVTQATRYPLLIDPQGQGKAWITNKEKENNLMVTYLNHKRFRNHVEDAVNLGHPLLIEDVLEELDPYIDELLDKNFIKQGRQLLVRLGFKETFFDSNFRLYITTKLGNPKYSPEVSARTSVIDFAVTMKGLEQQLLGHVIFYEKSSLEEKRKALIDEIATCKRQIQDLESNLLKKLASSEGSIVDDIELIQVLNNTKITSKNAEQKVATAQDTEKMINDAREEYRPVATRGSILYFAIAEMGEVNPMYQTSLKQFLVLFIMSIERSGKSPFQAKRVDNIINYLTYLVYSYEQRGLYERHKFMFILMVTFKIQIQQRVISYKEFQTFIKGGVALDIVSVEPKPVKWITDTAWLNLVELSSIPYYYNIIKSIQEKKAEWKKWFDSGAPEATILPDVYGETASVFQRLLLIRCWCPDRTIIQARQYVETALGSEYVEPLIIDYKQMLSESTHETPLIGLLSAGADPSPNIAQFAREQNIDINIISMGQGQEVATRKFLELGFQNGTWLLMQNCHLALKFMEEVIDMFIESNGKHNPEFRLWITTEVHPQFPIALLQISTKFSNEPPRGVRAGLKAAYSGISQALLEHHRSVYWKPMLYTISLVQTVLQERRKFGAIGWNTPYEFNMADWNSSVQYMQNYLDDFDPSKGMSWPNLRYMLGQIMYGGRISDEQDKILLITLIRFFFKEEIIDPTYAFSLDKKTGVRYDVPVRKTVDEYLEVIDKLPIVDSPRVFRMHPNSDIVYLTNMVENICNTMLDIQPKESAGSMGETREEMVQRMATDMLKKMPEDYVAHVVHHLIVAQNELQPLTVCLKQEVDRMQKVIKMVRTTLVELRLAIDGTIMMNEELVQAMGSIADARVPATWLRISWEKATIGMWFTELIERNVELSDWLNHGRPNVYWLPMFMNPQGFLTAMRQETTRANKDKGWALDSVVLFNDVLTFMKEDIHSPPDVGVYIYGLFLEGAGWNKKGRVLVEQSAKVLYQNMPVIKVFALEKSELPDMKKLYCCPLYQVAKRTDDFFICNFFLNSDLPPDEWTMRGTALLGETK